jgi:plasmid stabilization system protein ParE
VDFEVVWTEPAVADLEAVVRRVARDQPAAAERLREQLLESVEVLRRFPFLGPSYEKDQSGRTREIACRQYRVFYRVMEADHRVEVVTVWHSSRREPRLPE